MKNVLAAVRKKARSIRYAPSIKVDAVSGLERLGSTYGGWMIKDDATLHGSVVISCGLGEDASFDAEMANSYGAKVVVVDPTPRAVVHFHEMVARVGKGAECGYVDGGKQPAQAYNLANVADGQIQLVDKALWINEQPVRFFKPDVDEHVSHSIKFDNGSDEHYIIVPTVTLASLMAGLAADKISMVKMDIEGAETEILNSIEDWGMWPDQILVEFDVLREPGPDSKNDVEAVDRKLRARGYTCASAEGRNYLFLRNK